MHDNSHSLSDWRSLPNLREREISEPGMVGHTYATTEAKVDAGLCSSYHV